MVFNDGAAQKSDMYTYKTCPTPPDCFEIKAQIQCDQDKCEELIICTQAKVSCCEAELFCNASDRLICELKKAKNLYELKMIVDIINSLLISSAAKEKSLAEIIKATHMPDADDISCISCEAETT